MICDWMSRCEGECVVALFLLFAVCSLLMPNLLIRFVEVLPQKKKVVKFLGLYAKSYIFKGFFDTVILLIFFVIALAGALVFLFDGIADVMVHYSIDVNDELIGLWWVMPAVFAVSVSWRLICDNICGFLKKTVGGLLAFVLIIMIAGELVRGVGSTNIIMVVNALKDALLYGGYPDGTVLAILKLGDIFVAFGIILFAGIIVAFFFSLGSEWRNRKMNNIQTDAKVVSVEQMQKSDRYTIENIVSGRELMKRAAQGVFDAVDWQNKSVAVVTGSGNNGGDGYALAEILAEHGIFPVIFRVTEKFSEDGRFYYERAKKLNVEDFLFDSQTTLREFDIIVDCIFGIGFKGVPAGIIAEAIKCINASGAYVVSVDINSGLNGDNGEASLAVKSDLTVSIGYFKKGMFCGKAPELIGSLTNVDIGIVLI